MTVLEYSGPGLREEATSQLRFVRRDGKMILQQWWIVQKWMESEHCAGYSHPYLEWRDVPLVEEEGAKPDAA